MATIEALLVEQSPMFSPAELAMTMHALASWGGKERGLHSTFVRLMDIVLPHVKADGVVTELSATMVSQMFWALAKLQLHPKDVVQMLSEHVTVIVPYLNAHSISNIAYGLGKMQRKDAPVLRLLAAKALEPRILDYFIPQGMTNTLYSFAVLDFKDQVLMDAIGQMAARKCFEFKPMEMSNLLWSYATLHVYNAPLVEAAVQYIQTPEVLRRWPAGGLGNTAWALAVLGCRDRAVFRALAERAVHPAVLQAFSAWDMSNLMWAFATAGVQDMELMEAVSRTALERQLQHNHVGLALMAWSWATLQVTDTALMRFLLVQAKGDIRSFGLRSITNMAWAFGTLGVEDEGLLRLLAQQLMRCGARNPAGPSAEQAVAFSITVWALAMRRVRDVALMTSLGDWALQEGLAGALNAQNMANVLWAYSTLEVEHRPLVTAVAAAYPRLPDPGTAQTVSNMFLAYSRFGLCDAALFEGWARQLRSGAVPGELTIPGLMMIVQAYAACDIHDPEMLPWLQERILHPSVFSAVTGADIAGICSAFATLGELNDRLLTAMADRALEPHVLAATSSSEVASILYSFARFGHQHPGLLPTFAEHIERRVDLGAISAVDLATIVWAYATLGGEDVTGDMAGTGQIYQRLLRVLIRVALQPRILDTINAWSISNVAWGLGRLSIRDSRLLDELAGRAVGMVDSFTAQGIANTLWGLAQIQYHSPSLIEAFAARIRANTQLLDTSQALVNTLWALTVFDVVDDELLAALLQRAQALPLKFEELCQMHQLLLHVRLHADRLPVTRQVVTPKFATAAEEAFERRNHGQGSALQTSVADMLRDMGAELQEDVILRDAGGYTADIVLPSQSVVVEVDGPKHFVWADGSWKANGATVVKRQQLRAFGHPVVSVDVHEWSRLAAPDLQRQYLRDSLLGVLARDQAEPAQ